MNQPVLIDTQKANNLATIVYALQAAAFFNGITFLIAVIINYVKAEDVRGTLAESHFRWQKNTFWFSLLYTIIGFSTILLLVGYAILFINTVWVIYRIVKGWTRLADGKEAC
jgi:uncharacterized membrane protein